MRNKTIDLKKENVLEGEENNVGAWSTILALDLGTTTGWAIRHGYGIDSGSISFKPNRFEGGGMRYLRFQRWLTEALKNVGRIDEVYFEEVRRHLGVDAAHAYGGFLSHLTSWCEVYEVPYQGVPVGTIKKFLTGRGNASKAEMIREVRMSGHLPKDDNEADALALLGFAVHRGSALEKIIAGGKK